MTRYDRTGTTYSLTRRPRSPSLRFNGSRVYMTSPPVFKRHHLSVMFDV
jgi:hypothetical protein